MSHSHQQAAKAHPRIFERIRRHRRQTLLAIAVIVFVILLFFWVDVVDILGLNA